MAITSDHSLVEPLGPPPPGITTEEGAAVRRLIGKALPGEGNICLRGELEEMLLGDTLLEASAPEPAAWHPRHGRRPI